MEQGTNTVTVVIDLDFSNYWFKRWLDEAMENALQKLGEEADSQ